MSIERRRSIIAEQDRSYQELIWQEKQKEEIKESREQYFQQLMQLREELLLTSIEESTRRSSSNTILFSFRHLQKTLETHAFHDFDPWKLVFLELRRCFPPEKVFTQLEVSYFLPSGKQIRRWLDEKDDGLLQDLLDSGSRESRIALTIEKWKGDPAKISTKRPREEEVEEVVVPKRTTTAMEQEEEEDDDDGWEPYDPSLFSDAV
jgi:hypothetical protein